MTNALAEIIREEIKAHGPITFRRFMEQALYHAKHGYYAAGKAALGRRGDFFTSVSVGALFGRLLATQFSEMWERLGRPAEFAIVEQGAHEGDFARDVLESCAGEFRKAIRYLIIEPLPELRTRQQKALGDFREVAWFESMAEIPSFIGVHFSNELLDAMPVHLVVFRKGEWRERYVDQHLQFTDGPLSTETLKGHLQKIAPPKIEGYQTEVSLAALEWLDEITAKITRGFLLTIDYGFPREAYYSPDRSAGTLRCYVAHRCIADPLADPGERDITAHVDFTSIAERASELGWNMAGFTDQHRFIAALGESLFKNHPPDAKARRQFTTLMHPEMLGAVFRVLALSKDCEPGRLTGFRGIAAGGFKDETRMTNDEKMT